ncbi:hypothetical protein WL81_02555 [Burkholderia ubonensis]|nr:hypothetical protein WL81_02555 [Burkholderia ubonensis]
MRDSLTWQHEDAFRRAARQQTFRDTDVALCAADEKNRYQEHVRDLPEITYRVVHLVVDCGRLERRHIALVWLSCFCDSVSTAGSDLFATKVMSDSSLLSRDLCVTS